MHNFDIHGQYRNGKCNEDDPNANSVHHYCIKTKQHTGRPETKSHRCACGHTWSD
jgi:hypothetical protein